MASSARSAAVGSFRRCAHLPGTLARLRAEAAAVPHEPAERRGAGEHARRSADAREHLATPGAREHRRGGAATLGHDRHLLPSGPGSGQLGRAFSASCAPEDRLRKSAVPRARDKRTKFLRGPLSLEIARFGAPLAIGMALQTTFNLVDAWLVAQLPPAEVNAAVGAIGICDLLAAIGTIVSYGVSTASASILSRGRARGRRGRRARGVAVAARGGRPLGALRTRGRLRLGLPRARRRGREGRGRARRHALPARHRRRLVLHLLPAPARHHPARARLGEDARGLARARERAQRAARRHAGVRRGAGAAPARVGDDPREARARAAARHGRRGVGHRRARSCSSRA